MTDAITAENRERISDVQRWKARKMCEHNETREQVLNFKSWDRRIKSSLSPMLDRPKMPWHIFSIHTSP